MTKEQLIKRIKEIKESVEEYIGKFEETKDVSYIYEVNCYSFIEFAEELIDNLENLEVQCELIKGEEQC